MNKFFEAGRALPFVQRLLAHVSGLFLLLSDGVVGRVSLAAKPLLNPKSQEHATHRTQYLRFKPLGLLFSCSLLLHIFLVNAQEPHDGGATGYGGYELSASDHRGGLPQHREQQVVKLSYKYIIDQQAYAYRLVKSPDVEVKNFPLVHYDVDHTTTPDIKLGEDVPLFLNNLAFRFVDQDGEVCVGTLADFSKGKLLVLDFWATWCAPCVTSRNHWEEIKAELGDDVEVLAVMLDNDYNALRFGVDKAWRSPLVFGPEAYIINSMFFDRPVVSRMAWIKDGRLIAFTGTKGYDLQMVKDVIADKSIDIAMNLDYTYSRNQF